MLKKKGSMGCGGGAELQRSGGSASGGSPFSLSRFLPSRTHRRHRSKSRMSLDSDSTRSESSLASHTITSASLPAVHASLTPGPLPRTSHNPNLNSAAGVHPATSVHMSSADAALTACNFPPASVSSLTSVQEGGGASGPEEGGAEGGCRECPVCLTEQSAHHFPPIQTCHHRSCVTCLRRYLAIEISESRVNIACPECNERFHPNDMRCILEDEVIMGKYEDFMLRRVLATDPDTRWCPAPDCGYAVIASGCAGCPKLKCEREGCDTYFCYHCKQHWHPNQTCDAARAERSPNIRSASISYSHESGAQNEIKPCPRCGAFIVKMNDGSCNHMTCAVCAAEFCWLCMKEISDLHYLSPSGCTFWGRKPWSRKKKILWQLGTLVGAPVGITLMAGIAVPAMIIGIPVWVGRKVHTRYRTASKHRRNLAVAGGVVASILASPIIAGLAVGIGVPILLAYVYGVVPISLCRSGGCGVTTTNTGGVRFEFDEENEGNAPGNFPGDNHSENMPAVANPSIAPSIGDASLGMTGSLSASGSHMERVGVLRDADSDRDSASNRAIAGASLNGSLCGCTYTNKLEVQADVVPGGAAQKRASFSSESANISLSEKSATVSFDESSMRVYYTDAAAPTRSPLQLRKVSRFYDKEYKDVQSWDGEEVEASGEVIHRAHPHHGHSPSPDSCQGASATCTTTTTTPQSPRLNLQCLNPRGLGTAQTMEDGRHGTKCKKLTRFVDDVAWPGSDDVEASAKGGRRSREEAGGECSRNQRENASCPDDTDASVKPVRKCREEESFRRQREGVTFPGSCGVSGGVRSDGERDGCRVRKLSLESRQCGKVSARHSDIASTRSLPLTSFDVTQLPADKGTQMSGDNGIQLPGDNGTTRVNIASDLGVVVMAIPEVDTDKPVASRQSSISPSHTPIPKPLHHARSFSLSHTSLEGLSLSLDCKEGASLSMETGSTGANDNGTHCDSKLRTLRRHSYELAFRHGRISPGLPEDSH